jgi:orotidine-5'-phosphate decarboxylase
LSAKPIPSRQRLIVALDVPSHDEALSLVDELGDAVELYKVGLELFLAGDYRSLIGQLRERGKDVFADLKFFDVPATVAAAVRQSARLGVKFVTVHAQDAALEAAVAHKDRLAVLAVTVLTSLDKADLVAMGFPMDEYDRKVEDVVLARAQRALQLGADGVVSSGLEAHQLRSSLGDRFLIVSPGIRPVDNRAIDDQKRVMTPEQAFRAGADYVVVGRPIREAPSPRAAADAIQAVIASVFG